MELSHSPPPQADAALPLSHMHLLYILNYVRSAFFILFFYSYLIDFSLKNYYYLYDSSYLRRFQYETVQISLNSIGKVKSFVNAITQFDFDFDLISGRYVIDAKSIMGIFSLDLSKPIELAIHTETGLDEIMEVLKPYIIDEAK